ncbi:LOG family protein [Nitratiruptor sp. SB155-2]|uniref:LOG family protein n=1 Tax=Nitratiruptor sp. (strain SB155-2) TaxID=387092 RepID=UPI00030362E3|nr:LOG family protein [Nitratiruptor sp. SB155-2]
MKVATTFGASKADQDSYEYEEGIALGRFLTQQGFLVKCGGYGGLMEAVSKGVYEAGGTCIGIGLEAFDRYRPPNPYLSKKILAKTLYERLELLIEGSELFVAQRGSIGTLNEIFMVTALKYGGLKPDIRIVLLGTEYKKMNCFDENFLENVEIYDTLAEFQKNF